MQMVHRDDVIDYAAYEETRPAFRQRIIELKKNRRLQVGPIITFVFENHDTVLFQIQEMIRTERLVDEGAINYEIATYNQLVPGTNELSATMLIEITDSSRIKETISGLLGVNTGDSTWLEIGAKILPGDFDPGQSDDNRLSAVQYVKFLFDREARALFLEGEELVSLVINHPQYRHRAVIDGDILSELRRDLL
jgi:hypothetical protein